MKLKSIIGKGLYRIKKRKVLYDIKHSNVDIMTIGETLEKLHEGKSIARFGDGELDIILGHSINYQSYDMRLADKLRMILKERKTSQCLIGLPDAISTLSNLTQKSLDFWTSNMTQYRDEWIKLLPSKRSEAYGNANVSRCYIRYKDKSQCDEWFSRMMELWKGRDIVLVEGNLTRVGCGNDFLEQANSIKRILAPARNAFDKYDEILSFIAQNISAEQLILLALGPTATVLAYELSDLGYQALDLGHCDIEYEWFRQGVLEKTIIDGKYTNEVARGDIVDDSVVSTRYLNEIIKSFN